MVSINSFAQAEHYLARYHNRQAEYTLDNMVNLMQFLGNPQESFKVVHVAGTSGKTSTAYYMAALLTASGHKTGLTVSPHVDSINQRLQINMKPLGEKEFSVALSEFSKLLSNAPIKPSWFEAMIAFVYWYFAHESVDYAVIEVGLGGLKDATNVINRKDKVCIITDIGLDHTSILGDSLEEIAEQKLGIVHHGNAVFMFKQGRSVMDKARQITSRQKALLHKVNMVNECKNNAEIDFALVADYQKRNWLLAKNAYNYLVIRDKLPNLTRQVLQETLNTVIPGRMDTKIVKGKTIILDGAHNAQKMSAFVRSFKKLYPGTRASILIGIKDGKEYREIVPLVLSIANRIITTGFEASQDVFSHSIDPEILAEAFRATGADNIECIDNQQIAVNTLLASGDQICVITGSFYLIGQLENQGYLS